MDWTPAEDAILRAHYTTHSDAALGRLCCASNGGTARSVRAVERRRIRLDLQKGSTMPPAKRAEGIPEEMHREGSADVQNLSSKSTRIQTLDQLLAAAEVDLDVWEVERFTVNKWDVGAKVKVQGAWKILTAPLFQVKASLKRNRKAEAVKDAGAAILADIKAHAPRYPVYAPVSLPGDERHLLEVCAMDLHLGKLAWREEAGEDYDLGIARDVFLAGLEDLIQKASAFPIERILMPIGNDLLQYDNLQRTTTGGTPQDTDSRYAKLMQTAERLMVRALDRLAEIAPVEGVIVPGNHDRQSTFNLGRVLAAWYRNTDRVEIDCGPKLRKYKRYGVNLIGYTHGSEEKPADLPLLMATEEPELWAATKHREYHVGHYHKAKETRFTAGDSFNGVRVRIIPSLCAADAWHASKGYVGERRSAEAYLWEYTTGYAGHFSTNVMEPTRRAA